MYSLEISVVKNVTDLSLSSELAKIEIPINASFNIYNEGGGGGQTQIYASQVKWNSQIYLDTKINQLETLLNEGNWDLFKLLNTNGSSFTITEPIVILGVYIVLFSGTPTISLYVNSTTYLYNYVMTDNKIDINLNEILNDAFNYVILDVSNGAVDLYILYKKLNG